MQHLNGVFSPERRATAFSFRGLSMKLACGTSRQFFVMQTDWLARRPGSGTDENTIFAAAGQWRPWVFAGCHVLRQRTSLTRMPGAWQ